MSNANTQFKTIPLNEVEIVPGFNVRDMSSPDWQKDLEDFAQTIADDEGVNQPIRVVIEEGKYVLVEGHRRVMAARIATERLGLKLDRVPALITKNMTEQEKLIRMLGDRQTRQLKPLEVAEGVKRLVDMGMSQTEAAKRFGMTVAYAGDNIIAANAPEPIKEAIRENVLSMTEAVRAIKEHGPEDAAEIVEATVEQAKVEAEAKSTESVPVQPKATRRKVEEIAAKLGKTGKAPKPGKAPKVTVKPDPEEVTQTLAGKDMKDFLGHGLDAIDKIIYAYRSGDQDSLREAIMDGGIYLRDAAGYSLYPRLHKSKIDKDTEDKNLV